MNAEELLAALNKGLRYPSDMGLIEDAARLVALPILEKQWLIVHYCLTHESTTEPVWVLHVDTGKEVKVEGMYREDCNLKEFDARRGSCVFREFQLVPTDLAALIPTDKIPWGSDHPSYDEMGQ